MGRPTGVNVFPRMIEIFQKALGKEGTLSLPCYTFSAYNNQVFDPKATKSITGILGETARSMPGFIRTVHPVYSHVCWGKYANKLNQQRESTCFGKDSFFDIFCSLPDSYVMILGASFSALAFYHYYDQLFKAPGRFIKKFKGQINTGSEIREIEFDSYVKDHKFYEDKMNCLGRLDAVATELGFVKRAQFASGWIHGINEKDFQRLYKCCLETDQTYFLCSTKAEWEEYFPKNNFTLFHKRLDHEKVEKIKDLLFKNTSKK